MQLMTDSPAPILPQNNPDALYDLRLKQNVLQTVRDLARQKDLTVRDVSDYLLKKYMPALQGVAQRNESESLYNRVRNAVHVLEKDGYMQTDRKLTTKFTFKIIIISVVAQ
ncbi:MAG: hypothetical protein ABL951_04035 [Alphaproteobacteria bacterium]